VDAAARALVGELAARRFAEAEKRFDATMAAAAAGGEAGGGVDALLGKRARSSASRARAASPRQLQLVFVRCAFARAPVDVKVWLDAQSASPGCSSAAARALGAPRMPTPTASRSGPSPCDPPLEGTLTLPRGAGRSPRVALAHGSGPTTPTRRGRDQGVQGSGLGPGDPRRASLRYVKRPGATRRRSPPHRQAGGATPSKTRRCRRARGAGAAGAQPQIDKRRLFLVGHSLAAYLAPRIARPCRRWPASWRCRQHRPAEELVIEQIRTLLPGNASRSPRRWPTATRSATGAQARARVRFAGSDSPGSYCSILRGYHPPKSPPAGAADADPAGRARLSGDDGRFRRLAARAGGRANAVLKHYPAETTCSSPATVRPAPPNTSAPATSTSR